MYICGAVSMGGDVIKAILDYIIECGKQNEEAKNILNNI